MSKLFDYDVFVSFASAQKNQVGNICATLKNNGLRVFWSDESLKQTVGRESWVDTIQKALISSRHFLLLGSTESMASYWVKEEYNCFINLCHSKDVNNRLFVILPMAGFTKDKLPPFLQNKQMALSVNDVLPLLGGTNLAALQAQNRALSDQLSKVKRDNLALQRKYDELERKYRRLADSIETGKNDNGSHSFEMGIEFDFDDILEDLPPLEGTNATVDDDLIDIELSDLLEDIGKSNESLQDSILMPKFDIDVINPFSDVSSKPNQAERKVVLPEGTLDRAMKPAVELGAKSAYYNPIHAQAQVPNEFSKRLNEDRAEMRISPKISRNDPCHCGSGKVYKQCHGRLS